MKGNSVIAVIALLLAASLSFAQDLRVGDTEIVFASVEQGRDILMSRDAYVERMSPFDRSSRLQTDKPVSEAEYLAFIGPHVLAWENQDKQLIISEFEKIRTQLESFDLPLPEQILLIKTTGKQQGGAHYTRANAIVFPEGLTNPHHESLSQLIAHEIFHIISRQNPELRHRLYESIGFTHCGEGELPETLKLRKISNPDAPTNEHCIRVTVNGEEHLAIPLIYSRSENYDVSRGGTFFDYLDFKLLLVEKPKDSSAFTPLYKNGKPRLVAVEEVAGFFEQIGRNTSYIIHPEEALADNFALMISGAEGLPSEEIVIRMADIFRKAGE